jgi:hypothetical protein
MSGWIKIHRKIKDHWLFTEKRIYSKFEAWNFILLSCAFNDRKVVTGTHLIDIKRGQYMTTEAVLMNEFQWSKSKLRSFLKLLEKDEMILKESDRKKTIITVIKYEDYQIHEINEVPDPEKPKLEKKKPETKVNDLQRRKQEFQNQLKGHLSFYGPQIIDSFFNYWSEPNRSETKMKFELQQTFNIAMRLSTWQKNESKFSNNKTQNGTKKPNADDLLEQQRNSILKGFHDDITINDTWNNTGGFESDFTKHEEVE